MLKNIQTLRTFMFKKLVKYGNSYALVLDRSILGLLNLEDGATVKLRVEGDSLIVKGDKPAKAVHLLKAELESVYEGVGDGAALLKDYIYGNLEKTASVYEKNPEVEKYFKEWMEGSEDKKKYEEGLKKIFSKYGNNFQIFSSPEFIQQVLNLKNKFQGRLDSEEYIKEFLNLRSQVCPEIKAMDEEMKKLYESIVPSQILNSSNN